MPINDAAYMERQFRLVQSLGEKVNAGDATMEPNGFPGMYLTIKQFPHPTISGGNEIEVPGPGGMSMYQQQPIDTKVTGGITFLETSSGFVKQFFRDVIAVGGYFDCRIYEGTPERHTRSYLLEQCFVKIDPSDRDWENKTQVLMLTGTFFGHFFGRQFAGNA